MKIKIPIKLRSIFWDINVDEIDIKKHQNFLITRITEKGRWSDVLWLKRYFSLSNIKRVVQKSRNTSLKTKNFWQTI